jgi:hypothetical protein
MDLSFENLKHYAKCEKQLGTWNGVSVHAISENELKKRYEKMNPISDWNYWIVYDSNSRLVKDGILYGWVDKWGQLKTLNTPQIWFEKKKTKESVREADIFEDCFDTSWVDSILLNAEGAKG